MKDAAICIFAWDFADEGVDPVLKFVADAGLSSMFLASVYHAGWFVLPHNPKRTCYMPEDGAAYFHFQAKYFDDTPLKPHLGRVAAATDWFAEVGQRLGRFGLRLTAWTVCNHNTRLGLAQPEHTIRNALGDSYPHALTPASPAVRSYVRGLARNLAAEYPLQSIFLEAPNYRGRRHGHHHERDLTPFGPLENQLLDISFSSHDLERAESRGVDGDAVRRAVANHLRQFMANAPHRPRGMPETIEQFHHEVPDLPAYCSVLNGEVASLVAEIRSDVSSYGVELEGVEPIAAYDWRVIGAYGRSPEQVADLTADCRRGAAVPQKVRVGFRLGSDGSSPQGISSPEDCRQCVRSALENGADGVFFYNYSESPPTYLRWINSALTNVSVSRPHWRPCAANPRENA